jgi:nitrogen fixation protein FixH
MGARAMRIRVTQLTVVADDKPIFDESATQVEITDEGGGEFVLVRQTGSGQAVVRIDPHEWDRVREAIDQMIRECKQ